MLAPAGVDDAAGRTTDDGAEAAAARTARRRKASAGGCWNLPGEDNDDGWDDKRESAKDAFVAGAPADTAGVVLEASPCESTCGETP